ncbi:MAG: very-short-patch-repair endonuclease [Dasania sp.]|jgi:very-short-patch-repair endonuclease
MQKKKFWSIIKNKQTGYKFRRQQAINSQHIADFVCFELKLIIEIDGSQHCDNIADKQRTFQIENEGFYIIRFWNNEILENLEGCYDVLRQEIHNMVRMVS